MIAEFLPTRLASVLLAAAVLLAPLALTPRSAAAAEEAKPAAPEIGKPAPDFTLKDTEGKEHTLSALKGKTVVLVWFNADCPVVVDHVKADTFNKAEEKYKDNEDVEILLIDSTGTDADKAVARATDDKAETKVKSPLLIDADSKVGRLYHAKTTPHLFVIDKDGNLAYNGAIDNREESDKTGDVNYIDTTVDALLDGKPAPVKTSKPYGCGVKYRN